MSERRVTRLYGIINCASRREAMKHLDNLRADYEFVDLLPVKRPVLETTEFFSAGLNPGELEDFFGDNEKR